MSRLDRIEDLPGLKRVAPHHSTQRFVLAALAAAAWPPLIITLIVWPPENWASGVDTDWRLVLLVIGLIAAPIALWLMRQSHARMGRPATRLGVVCRFMVFGGLLAAAVQTLIAVVMSLLSVFASQSLTQGLGALETTLLIFGVAGLPLAVLVGVSYALWAGLCVAFIGFAPAPVVKDRMGLMQNGVG
jgi:predicted ABC-type sugar transport system permease subunit